MLLKGNLCFFIDYLQIDVPFAFVFVTILLISVQVPAIVLKYIELNSYLPNFGGLFIVNYNS